MKLVLANNQTPRFVDFYKDLSAGSPVPFEYVGYKSLLFIFDTDNSSNPVTFVQVDSGKTADDYDGVYINGYLHVYELAATVATILQDKEVPFVNRELENAPSLSKLSSYAKLAAAKVPLPQTYGGTAHALLKGLDEYVDMPFPVILKRADADRGIDNFKVDSKQKVRELLQTYDDTSLWVLQEFIPNDGFHLVSVFHGEPVFSIFRSLEERPDGNELKAHMFKPKGGSNAELLDLTTMPQVIVETSIRATAAMNRQIASVDSIYVPKEDKTYVLEVNYNPQLVTIETFKEVRKEAFYRALGDI